ncbi:carboxypeptidase regulatory-like domain-containing protein [Dyadobacter sp. Leaf189]|uniref:carboxypeptidase regulatory-like domain-containing protein n=1 Tax=Dyadobacter sp. Leaf189 TaxID=1736295 RepID=UPI000AEE0FE7|nr:carboxypeptidase regulatory-like domain-containing protein [Dyadobacter sp. Leaf189]
MRKQLIWLHCLAGMILLFNACKTDNNPSPDGVQSEKGYAVGKVTGTDGSLLKGVEIVVDNTMLYNSYALGRSDENGNYKIQLPKVGTFMASAQIKKEYNGEIYELDLDPDVYEEFSIDGAVRNFTWKLTGRRPEGEGYYGASIEVNKSVNSEIYDSENIEFTLTPVGNLIDGSKGKSLKLKHGAPFSKEYGRLVDVPLGRYRMTAYYNGEAGKMPLKLRKHFSEDAYEDELTIDFEPENIWGKNISIISYKE